MVKYTFIDGPMGSGKTTYAWMMAVGEVRGKSVTYIRPKCDTRANTKSFSTHNPLLKEISGLTDQELYERIGVLVLIVEKLSDINEEVVRSTDLFIIDEVHFYPDAYVGVKVLLERYGKDVVTLTPNSSYTKREKLGDADKLQGLADEHIFLQAPYCELCLKRGISNVKGIFSHKNSKEGLENDMAVADMNECMSLCRSCFIELNPEKLEFQFS